MFYNHLALPGGFVGPIAKLAHLLGIGEHCVCSPMDQHALQVLSIYRWHCIEGLTKPYGQYAVLEV